MEKRYQIDDDTKVPLKWVYGLVGVAATVTMVAGGLVLWGARLEAKTNEKVDRIDYVQDIAQVKSDLRAIKNKLSIKD